MYLVESPPTEDDRIILPVQIIVFDGDEKEEAEIAAESYDLEVYSWYSDETDYLEKGVGTNNLIKAQQQVEGYVLLGKNLPDIIQLDL
jgi:hypothetical protein